jgi:3-methyl-2-oxobutanoate hydroxymethyltransferase
MLGLNDRFKAKFLKKYAELAETVRDAARKYADEVRSGKYPGKEHGFK